MRGGNHNERMQIADDQLSDFIARWENAFGEKLLPGEARAMAAQLIELYRLLLRPLLPVTPPPADQSSPSALEAV